MIDASEHPYEELRRRRELASAARLELAHARSHPERMLLALWSWRDRQAMFGRVQINPDARG